MNYCVLCGWVKPLPGDPNGKPHPPRECPSTFDGHHRPTQDWRADEPILKCAPCGKRLGKPKGSGNVHTGATL